MERYIPGLGLAKFPDDATDQEIAEFSAQHANIDMRDGGTTTPVNPSAAPTYPALEALKQFISKGAEAALPGVPQLFGVGTGGQPGMISRYLSSDVGPSDILPAAKIAAGDIVGGIMGGAVQQFADARQIEQGIAPQSGGLPYTGPKPLIDQMAQSQDPIAMILGKLGSTEAGRRGLQTSPIGALLTTPPEAISKNIAGFIPGIGPLVAGAGEQLGTATAQGDLASAGGALGTMTGAGASLLLPQLAKGKTAAAPAARAGSPRINLATPEAEALGRAVAELRRKGLSKSPQGPPAPPTPGLPAQAPGVAPTTPGAASPTAATPPVGGDWPLPYKYPGEVPASTAPPVVKTLPYSRGQLSGSRSALWAEETLGKVFAAGAPIVKQRAALRTGIADYANAVVDDLGKLEPHAWVGDRVAQALESGAQGIRETVSKAWKQIDSDMANVQPDVTGLRARAKSLLADLEAPSKQGLGGTSVQPKVVETLQELAEGPNKVSFTALHDLRSRLREMVRSGEDTLPARTQAIRGSLAAEADKAMQAAAREASPELASRIRSVDRLSAEAHEAFDSKLAKTLAENTDPNKLSQIMLGAPPKYITGVMRNLPLKEQRLLRARVIRDWLDLNIKPATGIPLEAGEADLLRSSGVPMLDTPAGATPQVKFNSLVRLYERRPQEAWRALLTERQAAGLKQFARAVDRASLGTGSSSNWIGNVLNYALWGSAAKAALQSSPAAAYSLGGLATVNILSRILAKPGGFTLLEKALTAAPKRPSTWAGTSASQLGRAFQAALREEEQEPLGESGN